MHCLAVNNIMLSTMIWDLRFDLDFLSSDNTPFPQAGFEAFCPTFSIKSKLLPELVLNLAINCKSQSIASSGANFFPMNTGLCLRNTWTPRVDEFFQVRWIFIHLILNNPKLRKSCPVNKFTLNGHLFCLYWQVLIGRIIPLKWETITPSCILRYIMLC